MLELLILALVLFGAYAERKVLAIRLEKAALEIERLKSAAAADAKVASETTQNVARYGRALVTKIVTEAKAEAAKAEATGASIAAKVEEIAKKF